MRIRIVGTAKKCSHRLVCYAVRYYLAQLMKPSLMEGLRVTVRFMKVTTGDFASTEWMDSPDRGRSFRISLHDNLTWKETLKHLAHELVHVDQYATGRIRDYVRDDTVVRWKGVIHPFEDEYSEAYWFAPWEVEARGKERGMLALLVQHLNERKPKFWLE